MNNVKKKLKVAMFGSFYRGYYLLNELLFGEISQFIEIVGVATDDPKNTFISADKRVWQYPHSLAEAEMVENLALEHNLPVFKDRINTDEFFDVFKNHWQPDCALMATFGQRIGPRLINTPSICFYNLHPCIDDQWPSKYVGGNPFNGLIQDGHKYTRISLHEVDEGFDTGKLIKLSDKIAIPPNASVIDMHKITAFAAAKLATDELLKIISNRNIYGDEIKA
jgi:methionyl-tRNA formyltransferase